MTTCIGCGCDDAHACPGGCSWVAKSPAGLCGVCSGCADVFDADSVAPLLAEAEADITEDEIREQRGGLVLPGDSDFGL